ncbi:MULTISPECIES: putative toxin-antitoxin system toxin component, PIN family [Sediminibacterium]|uniref:putative toxin-antitoxin system toxin component, PIN family n=1 Tax=Sediminibacterium TaxID=504481 RepID=UPI000422E173|nr:MULTISPECIES: putative toxin-antitoxin system toxin component, PIN family [Sediminibacterium]
MDQLYYFKQNNSLRRITIFKKIKILFSTELLDEIAGTISKPKLKKYFTGNSLEEMLTTLEPFIELIEVKHNLNLCRDPKDNFLLNLAKSGKADYLLTGDNDLLAIERIGKCQIIKINSFLELQ